MPFAAKTECFYHVAIVKVKRKVLHVHLGPLLDYRSGNKLHYGKYFPEMEYFPIRKYCQTDIHVPPISTPGS